MPYCKLSDRSKPRPDRLKAMLLERMQSERKTQADIAAAMGISLSTYQRLQKRHTDEWTVNQLTLALRAVDIKLSLKTNYAVD